jgi:hypothetical protein
MTLDQTKKLLYFTIFKVVRMQTLPTMDDFLKIKNTDLLALCTSASPSDWGSYWQEILAYQIAKDCRSQYNVIIDNFDNSWFNDKNKTINDLTKYIFDKQVLLP